MVLEVLQFLPRGWLGGRFPGYRTVGSFCSSLPDLEVELENISPCPLNYTASLLLCFARMLSCAFLFVSFWHLRA